MDKNSLIIDIQYFGNLSFYKILCSYTYILIEQFDDHKKKSFSNRSVIAGANGKIILSVPLQKGRSQKTMSKDVRISNTENWQIRHLRSIVSSYNNSPWFKFMSDDLAVLYSRRYEYLQDWNLACLDWTLKIMNIHLNYELSKEWCETSFEGNDFRNKIHPGSNRPDIIIRYPQVFEDKNGFFPELSILDFIFCEGPKNAASLLKKEG